MSDNKDLDAESPANNARAIVPAMSLIRGRRNSTPNTGPYTKALRAIGYTLDILGAEEFEARCEGGKYTVQVTSYTHKNRQKFKRH